MMEFVKLQESEVYRDPIHGYVHVKYQLIKDLIESPEFQRMKRIHQLGGTLEVFPTAEHSRFSHCLGAYEIVRKVLEESEEIREALTEEEQMTMMCAALLHDIGHGPLSHAFEMVHPVDHEQYTVDIILGDTKINKILSQVDKRLPEKVASVISHQHPHPILIQLISSQLDADRLDFLLRDAYFTGTAYGYVDIGRLFRGITVDQGRVVYKESNVPNIENIMMGRYHMYTQVYFHPASYAYEVMVMMALKRFFDLAKKEYKFINDYKYLLPFVSGTRVSVQEYLMMDDSVLYYYLRCFSEENDPILKDLGNRSLNRDLLSYKHVSDREELDAIRNDVIEKGYSPEYYFCYGELSQQVYQKYSKNDTDTILIKKRNGEIMELSKVSPIVRNLSSEPLSRDGDIIVVYI